MINKQHALYKEDISHVLSTNGIERLKGKSILITGATGLLGTHFIDAMMALGDVKIYAIGRNKKNAYARLGEYYNSNMFEFIEQDVLQPLPQDINPDFIIPLASNTHPLAYSQHPVETMLINIEGAKHAIELSLKCNAEVLYPSSVEIYGNAKDNDIFTESYTGELYLNTSRSCYTESKRSAEALCQSYISEYGAQIKIARLSRIFGPTMLIEDSKASSQFIKKAINNEDIILKSEGNQYFSYTYATDAVRAILHIMLYGENGKAYNVSCDACNTHLKDFAQICANYNNKSVVFDLPTETEKKGFSIAMHAILDNKELSNIGFTPLYDIEGAIKRTIKILRNE